MLVFMILAFVAVCWAIGRASLSSERRVREEGTDLYCDIECIMSDKPSHKFTTAAAAASLGNPMQLKAALTFGELQRRDR